MAVEQIDIEMFLELSNEYPVFDVRSPAEYSHAHIPGAFALPLFTDDQRNIIGTAYKQQSRQVAVLIGLDHFSERMKLILPEVEEYYKFFLKGRSKEYLQSDKNTVLVHCWRGGMRSGAVAWLLNLFGFKVFTLKDGYKSFRKWVLSQFEKEYEINILGGFTGSGKSVLLEEMKKKGFTVINLEKLANHKGSAFGSLGETDQPGQEMFENLLATELYKIVKHSNKKYANGEPYTQTSNCGVWLEDESRHIGTIGIPNAFWNQMRKSPLFFIDIPFEERLKFIVASYGQFKEEELVRAIEKIQKRLGGLETKNAIKYLRENNLPDSFRILLHYYDKWYLKSLLSRENINAILNKIPCPNVDISNVEKFGTLDA
jgi:tRNA 2-selenouridine synthase